jgi:hypothetical protein
LSNRISAGGGSGSVTSTELSVAEAALSARVNSVVYVSVQNLAASALSIGQAVFLFTSAYGVKKATASRSGIPPSVSANNYVFGVVADAAIAVSAVGLVQRTGLLSLTSAQVRNVAWDGASSWTPGDRLGLHTTSGQLIPNMLGAGDLTSCLVGYAIGSRVIALQIGTPDILSGLLVSAVNAISNRVSALCANISAVSALSVGGVSTHGL